MFAPMIKIAVILSIPAMLLGLLRHKWWWSGILMVVGLGLGLSQKVLFVNDLWDLPIHSALMVDAQSAFYWLLWSLFVGSIVDLPDEQTDVTAVWTGFCFGTVASAMMWKRHQTDVASRARNVFLSILGAGMHPFGILGGLAIWTQVDGQLLHHILGWLPIFAVGLFLLKAEWDVEVNNQVSFYLLSLFTMVLLYLLPQSGLVSAMILLGSALVFAVLKRHQIPSQNWKGVGQIVVSSLCAAWVVNLAVAGGMSEIVTWGLEDAAETLRPYLVPVLNFAAILTSALVGQWNMSLFVVASQERLLDLSPQYFAWMPISLALGGAFPFWIAESFKAIWKTFIIWMGIGAMYLVILSGWM